MKKNVLFTICVLFALRSISQYSWTQKQSMPTSGRFYSTAFSIGHYGFVGGGSNGSSDVYDFWKWDKNTNTWTQIANYPGIGSAGLIAFTINGIGYVGFGTSPSTVAKDLWAYDTTSGNWTPKATFPGTTARYACFTFVIGNNAYVGCGDPGAPPYLNDVWEYNSVSNKWTQKTSFPLSNDAGMVGFAIGKHGYAGTGGTGLGTDFNNFYEYDTASDTWTATAALPYIGSGLDHDVSFIIDNQGFVGTGRNTSLVSTREFWAYDTTTGTWGAIANLGGVSRNQGTSFSIGNCGYATTGMDSLNHPLNDLWQYGPLPTGLDERPTNVNIKIYPNPSNGILNFYYSGNIKKGEIKITDLVGRVNDFHEINGTNGRITINETTLPNGMYLYQLLDSDKLVSSGKFIIQK